MKQEKKYSVLDAVLTTAKKPASTVTQIMNTAEAYRAGVVGKSSTEYQFAKCGCCSGEKHFPMIETKGDGAQIVWDQSQYQFLNNTYDISGEHLRVHPSLWNNGSCNVLSGVFEVLPGKIYQVRGYDMANITFVKTPNNHWIVMDTLMSKECTEAALNLFRDYLRQTYDGYELKNNIVGMIVSHSHVDHYGGMSVVKEWFTSAVTEDKEDALAVPFILAPEGFVEHSVSENVYVGNAMGRRASYQYGSFIKPSYSDTSADEYLSGEISIGIGQGQSTGNISFELPTREISENCKLTLDGLTVEFQLTPGTEAPAEMNNYFPDYQALWLAENCNGTLHNLYTLRGAQVRDGKAWASYLMETVALYGDEVQVIFQSHNWPHWDEKLDSTIKPTNGIDSEFPKSDLRTFLIDTAAIYKYINDQTLLYVNMGYKMNEASDMLTLPRAMQKNWCLKPFYGTPKHNAKAVYQRYIGWYDANPLHLEELPPEQLAKEQMRYVLAGGSVGNLFELIQTDIDKGNYWIAAYMAHQIVLGASDKSEIDKAKLLCADAMEQLGYQSESGTWRNAYLTAAFELRNGKSRVSASPCDMSANMTSEMLLDYISIFFDGEKGTTLSFNGYLTVTPDGTNSTDDPERFIFVVKNGSILYWLCKNENSNTKVITSGDENAESENSVEEIEITRSDLQKVFGRKYGDGGTLKNIFHKIQSCMVNVETDRYKYFDIMTKHDAEVLKDDKTDTTYDLVEMAKECFYMLEKYVTAFYGDNAPESITLGDSDVQKWRQYYSILEANAGILNCGSFLATLNGGYANAGCFTELELYYNLYCLLRYLAKPYVKNSVGFEGDVSELERYTKLKKLILMLETYVSDCYQLNASATVTLDEDDADAWNYIVSSSLPDGKMDITYFFWVLYSQYREFARSVRVINAYLSLKESNSDNSILVGFTFSEDGKYTISYGSDSITVTKTEGEFTVNVGESDDYIIFKVVDSDGNFCDSLTFYKPWVSLKKVGVTQITAFKAIQSSSDDFLDTKYIDMDSERLAVMPYNCPPDPTSGTGLVVDYDSRHAFALEIAEGSVTILPSGSVIIPESAIENNCVKVMAQAKCGYYCTKTIEIGE